MFQFFLSVLVLAYCVFPAAPRADTAAIKAAVAADITSKLNSTIINAIVAQNTLTSNLTEAEIRQLDAQWLAELAAPEKPLINKVLNNPASDALRHIAAISNGRYIEIFVTDARGLNVAMTETTSDYWQGDEAKFQQTFPLGPTATYIDEPRFDESAKSYVMEVDGTIALHGKPIGTFTVKLQPE